MPLSERELPSRLAKPKLLLWSIRKREYAGPWNAIQCVKHSEAPQSDSIIVVAKPLAKPIIDEYGQLVLTCINSDK